MCLTNDGGNRANRLGGDPNWYTSARNMMFSSATCDDLSASSRSDDTYSMERPPPLSSRLLRPRIEEKFAFVKKKNRDPAHYYYGLFRTMLRRSRGARSVRARNRGSTGATRSQARALPAALAGSKRGVRAGNEHLLAARNRGRGGGDGARARGGHALL